MTTVLRVDSSSRTAASHSRALVDYFEKAWHAKNPDHRILQRDLVTLSLPQNRSGDRTITLG